MPMLRLLALILLVALLPLACTPEADTDASPPILPSSSADGNAGNLGPAPDVTLLTLSGDTLRLPLPEAQLTLVNFWATWCGPCIEEIPELTDLYTELHPYGLEIIGISLDEEGAEVVAPFAAEMNVNYPIAFDDGTVAEAFGGAWALPTTYLLGADGTIEQRVVGLFPVEEYREAFRQRLGAPAAR